MNESLNTPQLLPAAAPNINSFILCVALSRNQNPDSRFGGRVGRGRRRRNGESRYGAAVLHQHGGLEVKCKHRRGSRLGGRVLTSLKIFSLKPHIRVTRLQIDPSFQSEEIYPSIQDRSIIPVRGDLSFIQDRSIIPVRGDLSFFRIDPSFQSEEIHPSIQDRSIIPVRGDLSFYSG
ncbi:hypothetical protein EVAR_45789_1 [Eumeta japonica]|uniref:Uncharacterized protein n=1 Tax=Eumeta variegata TaxID=151549 RepID=A0A4C1X3V7_EUMVA|nr:hypothetical protein EVAR_45789_1 [Eumeta japonica]